VANVHALVAGVKNELWVFLIDGVVGKVYVLLPKVVPVGRNVGLSGKAGQSLFVYVYP
jgi:hypothetical protein